MDTSQLLEEETKEKSMDLIWKGIDGTIKLDQLISNLNELKEKYGKQYESLLADVISIIDVEIGSFLNVSATVTSSSSMFITSNCNEDSASNLSAPSPNPIIKKEKFYSIVNALRNFIGDDMLKERLEIETLENLKLIPKKEIFNQKYIKIKTRLFYKQQKFNLLREESEGYSKLITELGQTNLNNKILENIQSLIGCFNLDPNRVLDVILESFENNPSMYETFISLLRHYKAEDDTICQILGFKFQSLNHSQASASHQLDSNSNSTSYLPVFTNQSLYKITSYLLKYKIIDLDLLLSHLYPNEQQLINTSKDEFELARQYAKKLTSINLSEASVNAPQGTLDSLAAGTSPHGQAMDNDKSSAIAALASQASFNALLQQYQHHIATNRLENQRTHLIKALIEIGDYKTALRLIEKLPHWYLALNCDLTLAVCKSLDVNFIDSMYKKYNLLSKYLNDRLSSNRASSSLHARRQNIQNNNQQEVEMTWQRDDNALLDEFVENILPVLCALGPGLSYDTILFTKLVRICIAFLDAKKFTQACSVVGTDATGKEMTPPPSGSMTNGTHVNGASDVTSMASNGAISGQYQTSQLVKGLNSSELAFYNSIYTILNEILLPSLSMLSMNPCLAIELWNLLKLFPYEMRYNLYQNWRLNTYKNFPSLIRAKADSQEKIKYLLKRLTKENVKIHGRQIGKLSHNNPIIVCDYILGQIQRYDNFILPVVESLKFMTPLSYDVLSYCIIVAISDAEKDKMKHDSTNLSSWLQSIATFCALTFKKYPIELIAIIQYVINQLKMRKGYDLFILQEIVQKMSGIEVLSEVNDLQLEAMAGGDLLRQEAGYFNPIRNIKKCANRLKEALADYGLILPLCILLSQQRDYIVFLDQVEREKQMMQLDREKPHLKLIGCFYDQCQDSLVQFSQFLSSTLTTEEYIHIFPKIDELVNEYHVSADVAFFLSRPMYAHHIQSKYEELRRMDRNTKSAEKPSKTQRYLESIEFVMQPVIDLARSLHPAKIWEDMSPLFYTTFWTLSMSDCFVPSTAYEKQRASLKQKLNALDDNPELTSTKKKKEKEKILIMMEKLNEEEAKQRDHVQHVRARFEKEKDFWFPQKVKPKNETITVFLQLCIFSRCLFTQIDAYYCAKFIQIIHSLKTPNFSTIICYDRIFSDISYSIASLTENEARRYGRFLLGLLDTVMTWHSDPAIFDQECAQHPGFLTVFRNALNSSPSAASNKQEQLDYENFRHVCYKWHYTLTKSFIVCLESEDYLQMRNSLIILTKILPYYPKLAGLCAALEKRVEKLKQTEKDKRQDIYTLALAYLGQLKQRKQYMLEEGKFHQKQATPAAAASGSAAQTSSKNQQFKQPNIPPKSTNVNGTKHTNNSSVTSSTVNNQHSNGVNTNQVSGASTGQNQQASANDSNNTKDVKTSSSKTSQPKESSTVSSAPVINRTSSSAAVAAAQVQSSSGNVANVKTEPTSSPPSAKSSNQPSRDTEQSKQQALVSNTNGNSKQSSSSSKRPASVNSNHSPSSSQQQSQNTKQEQLTPTRNGNVNSFNEDYSPASSVSSDDLPLTSPKATGGNGVDDKYVSANSSSSNVGQISSSTGRDHHHHHHQSQSQPHRSTHSRSSSPGKLPSSQPSSSNNHSKSSQSDSKSSKRLKSAHDDSNLNGNKNASGMESSSQPQSHTSSQSSAASTSSSSSKRKSSRDRDRADKDKDRSDTTTRSERDRERLDRGASDRNDRASDRDSKESSKKEHRKREHSSESSEIQHKRSKSDEAKKKSSSSTSSSSQQQQQQQPQQSSSSLSSKRSSKKHDLNDDYQSNNNVEQISLNSSSGSSSTRQSSSSSQAVNLNSSLNNGSSSKHRSSDDRRISYDKSSSSYKR